MNTKELLTKLSDSVTASGKKLSEIGGKNYSLK